MSFPGMEDADVTGALEKILRQPEFASSPRLSSFLRFVVEETLAGRSSRLKAFTIATSVFGRDEAFDPQTNPIVRVEALRLRRMLDQYYAGAGAADPLEIRIRRGSYIPEFTPRISAMPQAQPLAAPPAETEPEATAPPPPRRIPWLFDRAMVAALAVVLLALVPLGIWAFRRPAATEARMASASDHAHLASIRVGPFQVASQAAGLGAFAALVESRIEDAISRFDNPVVVHDAGGVDLPSTYQITAVLTEGAAGTVDFSFRMLHVPSREIVWTRQVSGVSIESVGAGRAASIDLVAASVAQTYGAVYSDMRKRLPASLDQMKGYDCVILAYGSLISPERKGGSQAFSCLETVVAADPNFAPAHAALAMLWTAAYLEGGEGAAADLERASEYARQAVTLAPQKARSHSALFWTRFYEKRFDDAFDSARIAVELNPFAIEPMARIGVAHMLRGQFDEARPLIARAVHASAAPPGWLDFYLFLDAWQQGDRTLAHRHAIRRSSAQFPLGILARIITANESGDAAAVAKWSDRLSTEFPHFAADLSAALDRYAMAPALRDKLLAALDEAGVPRTRVPIR